jgi:hypothetical protein
MPCCLDCWAFFSLTRDDFNDRLTEKNGFDAKTSNPLSPEGLRRESEVRKDAAPWLPIRGRVVSASELQAALFAIPEAGSDEQVTASPRRELQAATRTGDKIVPGLPIAVPKIMLPKRSVDMNAWAALAGDKYTADEDYWRRAEAFYRDKPSAKNLIFPEVHLSRNGDGKAEIDQERMNAIWATEQRYLADGVFDDKPAAFIALERDSPVASDRRGLLVAVDLEHYGGRAAIRPSEMIIPERLPERIALREKSLLELPHIVMFIDDEACTVIEPLFDDPDYLDYAYTAELFGHAGQVRGSRVTSDGEAHVIHALWVLNFCSKYLYFAFESV